MKQSKHSERSKRNMTKQLTAQLVFYLNNLEKKQNRYQRFQRMIQKYPRLERGIRGMMKRQQKGIKKVKIDINNLQYRISMRLKDGEIFPITLE